MVHPTILALAVVVVWVTRHDEQLRLLRMWVQQTAHSVGLRLQQWTRNFYLTYRSEISLLIGQIFCFSLPFVCDCCCLRLGRQDVDAQYSQNCRCDTNAEGVITARYCFHCICTYVESQVTDQQATRPVCMTTRRCELDDRLVRKRLSSAAVSILDRNQIISASRAAIAPHSSAKLRCTSSEKLWHCPSPDCSCLAFISNDASPHPERLSAWQLFSRYFSESAKADPRRVRCPICLISSCQFCALVWSRGTVDHTGLTCDKYATLLASTSGHTPAMLAGWKARAGAQQCRNCHATIEKNDGCKHMTCRCGYEFCWTCGAEWTPQHMLAQCRRLPPRETNAVPENDGQVQQFVNWMISWIRV